MKKWKVILILFFTIFTRQITSAQCWFPIVLLTQEDVDNFPSEYGCSEINANLTIGSSGAFDPSNITNLDSLSIITKLNWSLIINQNPNLENLNGLENLTSITNNLRFFHNTGLLNLNGLENLTNIGGDFTIEHNNIDNFDGLENLINIGESLVIQHNYLLDMDALANVASIGENLQVNNNDYLTECCVLVNLVQNTSGNVSISNNDLSCSSMENVIFNCSETKIIAYAFFDNNQNNIKDETEPFLSQNFVLNPSAIFNFTNQDYESIFILEESDNYILSYIV